VVISDTTFIKRLSRADPLSMVPHHCPQRGKYAPELLRESQRTVAFLPDRRRAAVRGRW
jgi:hypothetical protein